MTESKQGITHTANRIKFSRMNDRDPAADLIAVLTLELHLLETTTLRDRLHELES